MPLLDHIRTYKTELETIGRGCGVSNIRVFGSVVRGDESPQSDIDLLITFNTKTHTGFDLGGFQYSASELLGRRVDVVMDSHIHPMLAPSILKEAVPL